MIKRQDQLKVEQKTPITADHYIPNKLLDGTKSKNLLDIGASMSFISNTFYLNCLSLYSYLSLCQRQRIF